MVGGKKMSKFSLSDKTFHRINFLFVLTITLIIIYPNVFVLCASISDPQAVNTGKLWIWPVDITFDGFARIFQNKAIWIGYRNTIYYTFVGVCFHLFVFLSFAYALSRKDLLSTTF